MNSIERTYNDLKGLFCVFFLPLFPSVEWGKFNFIGLTYTVTYSAIAYHSNSWAFCLCSYYFPWCNQGSMTERWRWSFHVVTGFVWLTRLMNSTKTTRHQLPTCFVTTTSSLIYRLQPTKQSTLPSCDISERYGRLFRGDSNLSNEMQYIQLFSYAIRWWPNSCAAEHGLLSPMFNVKYSLTLVFVDRDQRYNHVDQWVEL